MSKRTDDRGPSAGEPQALAVASAHVSESKTQAAWRAYLDHGIACTDCPKASFQCPVAAELYRAYKAAGA